MLPRPVRGCRTTALELKYGRKICDDGRSDAHILDLSFRTSVLCAVRNLGELREASRSLRRNKRAFCSPPFLDLTMAWLSRASRRPYGGCNSPQDVQELRSPRTGSCANPNRLPKRPRSGPGLTLTALRRRPRRREPHQELPQSVLEPGQGILPSSICALVDRGQPYPAFHTPQHIPRRGRHSAQP